MGGPLAPSHPGRETLLVEARSPSAPTQPPPDSRLTSALGFSLWWW